MARGRDAHQARLSAVAALGKNLSRRAGSRCELCEGSDDLRVHEVPPVEEDPDEAAAILACAPCRDDMTAKRLRDFDRLRFLETAMWSETPPVQVAAVRLLHRLSSEVDWARDALDGLWLDEAIQERVAAE